MSEHVFSDSPLFREVFIQPSSLNEQERSVEVVLSTPKASTVVDRRTGRVFDEVLLSRGAEYPAEFVMLDSHQLSSTRNIRGSIRNIRQEGEDIVARAYFSRTAAGEDDWQNVKDGHLRRVSIGYFQGAGVEIPAGQTRSVEGVTYTAGNRPLRITQRFRIYEGSLVPVGANDQAVIRQHHDMGAEMPDVQVNESVNEATERAAAVEQPADMQRAAPTVAHQPATITVEAQGRVDVPDALRRQIAEQERTRVAMCRSAVIDGVDDTLVERAINEGWDEARVNREYLAAHRAATSNTPISGAPAGHVRSHEGDVTTRALAAGLLHRIGATVIGATLGFSRSRLTERDADMGDRLADMSLLDMCREAVRIDGGRDPVTGMQPYGRSEFIRAATSSPTFSNIFTTSVNARMLAGYEESEDTTDWCSEEDVTDFKTNDRIGLGKHSNLKKLPAGGTADHSTVSDNVESYKIARYARQFFMDEQDILSDNMDAIQNTPFEMGMAAMRLRPDLVYAALLRNASMRDGVALFHSDHSNTNTLALATSTSLPAVVAAMYAQVEDSVRLNLRPKYLIVNPTLEGTARQLVNSELLITGSDVTVGNLNWLKQLGMQVRVEGRLDATGVTDPSNETAYTGSTTTWFAAAQSQRTIRVGYLAGTGRRPQIRRSILDRGQWGIGWDINMDIGVKALDWRGIYRGNT